MIDALSQWQLKKKNLDDFKQSLLNVLTLYYCISIFYDLFIERSVNEMFRHDVF